MKQSIAERSDMEPATFSNKPENKPQRTCARCGGTQFEAGHLMIPHGGEVVFRLFKTSITQRQPNIAVSTDICMSCGALEFTADPEKARELLK